MDVRLILLSALLLSGSALASQITHTVVRGDTAFSIARSHGLTVAELLERSGLSTHDLEVGQVLVFDTAKRSAPQQAAAGNAPRAAQFSLAASTPLPAATVPAPAPVAAAPAPAPVSVAAAPAPAPALVTAPVVAGSAAPELRSGQHRVVVGDTAFNIARRFGLSVDELIALNSLPDHLVHVGQVLSVVRPASPAAAPAPVVASAPAPAPARAVAAAPVVPAPAPVVAAAPALAPAVAPASSAEAALPAGMHAVVTGDTAFNIAQRYGLSVEQLLRQNGMSDHTVHLGQTLNVARPAALASASSAATIAAASEFLNVRDHLVSEAQRWAPVRYVLGGNNESGIDCSGLVIQVLGPLGVSLPRQSAAQYRAGSAVGPSDLLPGDLVFFDTMGRGTVSHVGIYLGGGEFMHANSFSNRVTVNRLSEAYYATRYLGARRVLGPQLAGR